MKLLVATWGKIHLFQDEIKKFDGFSIETYPLDGVTATVESGTELDKRITATRLVTLGVFSLAAKKSRGGEWWMTIEGPEFAWADKVDRKKIDKAKKFAVRVQTVAKQHTAKQAALASSVAASALASGGDGTDVQDWQRTAESMRTAARDYDGAKLREYVIDLAARLEALPQRRL